METLVWILSVSLFLVLGFIAWLIVKKYDSLIEIKQETKGKPRKKESAISSLMDKLPLGNLIGGFIVILVGISLIPVVADRVNEVTEEEPDNKSPIGNLVIVLFALGILVAGVVLAMGGLRKFGLV